jgi:hypothetical protein
MTLKSTVINRTGGPVKASSAFGWAAIFLVFFLGFAGGVAGQGNLIRLLFPAFSLVVALYLYLEFSLLYVGFTWWIWCLTPLIRRLCDYYGTPDPNGIILLTPYLVTFVSVFSLIKYLPKVHRMGGLPFIAALLAVVYAFMIGVIQNPTVGAIRAFLDWVTPIIFAFYLFSSWSNYPDHRDNIQKTFLWLTLVTGVYGIFQYLTAPAWDGFWLEQTQIVTMGEPVPMGLRIWSTLHSPSPFATMMMACVLLLLVTPSKWSIPISIIGYLSFLLTLVRSAWGGWFVGLLTLVASLRPSFQIRLVLTGVLIVLLLVPVTSNQAFSDRLNERFDSIVNIQQDRSLSARQSTYDRDLNIALSQFLGRGMGSTWVVNPLNGQLERIVLDSGILDSFFTLGWAGTIFYMGGLITLLGKSFRDKDREDQAFTAVSRSISLGIVAQLGLSSLMIGFSGMVLWSFVGISMAAQNYHTHTRKALSRAPALPDADMATIRR